MNIRSYTQFNDEVQMRNYRHDKQGIPANYSVDAQRPRFLFIGREVTTRAETGASLNTKIKIGFAIEE